MSRALRSLSVVIAVVLVLLLCMVADVGIGDLSRAIGRVGAGAFALVLGTTAGLTVLSTEKWVLLLRRQGREAAPFMRREAALFYSSLGSVLGQFLPLQVAIALTRSVGLRLDGRGAVSWGVGATVVEQVFDGIVAVVLAVPALLLLLGQVGLATWAVVAAAGLGAGWFGSLFASRVAASAARRLSGWPRLPASLVNGLRLVGAQQLRTGEVTQLYGLSVARSICLIARVGVVAAIVAVPGALTVALLTPLVQLPVMVAMTPGGLGVAEWTWSALLAASGVSFGDAGLFGLVLRVLSLAALGVVVAGAGVMHVWARTGHQEGNSSARKITKGGSS